MAKFLLAPRNFIDIMTTSSQIAPAVGYETTNMQDSVRSSFWQSPDATDQWVGFALASGSFTCNGFWMSGHHNHGGSIQVVGYPNNDFTGSPTFDTNVQTIFTAISTGYDWGYADYPGLDTHDPLGLDSNYAVFFTSAPTTKSIKVFLSSKSTTYGRSYWRITRAFLGNYLQFAFNPIPHQGFGIGRASNTQRARSGGGSLLATQGASWPLYKIPLQCLSETEIPALLDIMDYCDTGGTIAGSIRPGAGGREERDGIFVGTMSGLNDIGRRPLRGRQGITSLQIEGN
jgi:hypothetical protein